MTRGTGQNGSGSSRHGLDAEESPALIERVQGGDRAVFATLYRRYFDRVYGLLRVLLRDPHEAEDVAQQVFTRAYEMIDRYENRGPFEAWLFAIARNQAISHLRKLRGMTVEDPADIERRVDDGDTAPEQQLRALRWISDDDLLMLIERLPLHQRQVLLFRYLFDLPPREIAEIVGVSPNHVSVLQYRALDFLRRRLESLGREARDLRASPSRRCTRQAGVIRRRRFALTP